MQINYKIFENIIKSMELGIYILDWKKEIVYWNKGAEKITGITKDEIVGNKFKEELLKYSDKNGNFLNTLETPSMKTIADGRERIEKLYIQIKNKERIPIEVQVYPLKNEENQIIGAFEVFIDISEEERLKEEYEKLKRDAFIDDLTGIPNKKYINKKLRELYDDYKRYKLDFSVLFLKIKNFNSLVEKNGKVFSEKALKQVAKKISSITRSSDFFGFWEGNTFILILRFVNNTQVLEIANRFNSNLKNIEIDETKLEFLFGGSIITEEDTIETLLEKAEKKLLESETDKYENIKL
ncbi:diguanylate cyclase [Tepiditoga spiralis]|uniref:Diguanylate cyclase n=1 Tax=Tepiditoga spiralis TaxID=2108365 RepID=A0A7G1G274_9BACT|nr:sensor domain-containing diguanylate cyclase [Tepiditoga spiralis]BBE30328.1 diguanylate cyclase [Tepiditoga spiralis]